jgi:hypothetical protein
MAEEKDADKIPDELIRGNTTASHSVSETRRPAATK